MTEPTMNFDLNAKEAAAVVVGLLLLRKELDDAKVAPLTKNELLELAKRFIPNPSNFKVNDDDGNTDNASTYAGSNTSGNRGTDSPGLSDAQAGNPARGAKFSRYAF